MKKSNSNILEFTTKFINSNFRIKVFGRTEDGKKIKHTRRSKRNLEAHRSGTFQQVHQASVEGWYGRLPLRFKTWTCSYIVC